MQYTESETLSTLISRERFDGRVNQYLKDRIESFDDYYPCMKYECNLFHVYNWIQFFVSMYNDTIANNNCYFGLEEMNITLS